MRQFLQLSLLLGLNTVSYAGTSIIDTLKTVDQLSYGVIADYISENEATLCLNRAVSDGTVRELSVNQSSEVNPEVSNPSLSLMELGIVIDTVSFFGKDFNAEVDPYITFVSDLDFRNLLANVLTDSDQGVRIVRYGLSAVSNSNSFVVMNYSNVIGIVTYFDSGSRNPVILLNVADRNLLQPYSLSVLPEALSAGCKVM